MNVGSWGGTWVGSLGVPHYESLTDKFKGKVDKDIHKKAETFLSALKVKTLPTPSIGRLIMFNIWKINAEVTKQELPKDYEHWTKTNWFNMDYYYSTKIGVLKKIVVGLVMRLARSQMKKVYKGY